MPMHCHSLFNKVDRETMDGAIGDVFENAAATAATVATASTAATAATAAAATASASGINIVSAVDGASVYGCLLSWSGVGV